MRRNKKKHLHRVLEVLEKGGITLFTVAGAILFLLPVLMLLSGSLADEIEFGERLAPMLQDTDAYITWKWMPDYPTFDNYKRLLFYTPGFLVLFWNSIKYAGLILAGQLLIGVPSAWMFAVYEFKGKKPLFTLYVILMLLPFQVTMLSRYLVLDGMGLMNTPAAVILPAIFSTFPVFLIYRSFADLPRELLEAARMDGAGEWGLFWHIGLRLSVEGISAAFILGFLECWNMLEEPMAFLKSQSLWPLSLYLPQIEVTQAGFACAAAFITVLVSLFAFAIFSDSLEKGIAASALKG